MPTFFPFPRTRQGRGSFARNRFSTGGTIYRVVDVTVDREDILEARKPG